MIAGVKKLLFNILDRTLQTRGMTIVSVKKEATPFTMRQALKRAREHSIQVGTIIDIGASNGKWSKLAMECFPTARYLLLEPLEERRAELEKLRGQYPNLQFVLAAVGAESGRTVFRVTPDLDGSAIDGHPGEGSRSVDITAIDEEVEKRGLPGPYLLKFDTHGFEIPILDGAAKTLRNTSLIIMEAYNFKITPTAVRFPEMCMRLEKLGFRCYDMVDLMSRREDSVLWQMDLFFCPANSSLVSKGDV